MLKFLLTLGLLGVVISHPCNRHTLISGKADTCGYSSCPTPQPGKLNVHLVPHTHDDVGWLNTVDQYYYQTVQYILDSVVDELSHDPNKKFIYVETAFFWKWWLEQSEETQNLVKELVSEGKLEFIGGAWAMNDEAAAHYHSVIDQFTWGLRKLNDTFGYCGQPKIGWQIDPFGHSRETASIMANIGFDGLFFARLDFQDYDARLKAQTLEMIWEGSPSLGSQGDLLTGVIYDGYGSPPNFCFDVFCGDEPIIDNTGIPDYNANRRIDEFIDYVHRAQQYYRTNNLLITMGTDFQYVYAHKNFKNMDKLIKYVNQRQEEGSDVNVFYSTPSCYVKSLNEANITWPTKQDDFFPYASDPHSYWTGYFTSRPTLKYFERKGNNFLQVCKQLTALANFKPQDVTDLDSLREAMGILQHHDGVSGTEKQHVANDYARQLSIGFDKCGALSSSALSQLHTLEGNAQQTPLVLTSCPLTNISECSVSANSDNFIVTVYNPISRPVNHIVRLPVSGSTYLVRDPAGAEVVNQVIPIPSAVANIPGRTSTTTQELIFSASDVPPVGFRSYYISKSNVNTPTTVEIKDWDKTLFGNEKLKFTLDRKSGLFSSISNGKVITFSHTLYYYVGALGDNGASERRSSGAYILRTDGHDAIEIDTQVNDTLYEGPLVNEYHITLSDWASLMVRQYVSESHLEFEWLVGPIPIDDGNGKEVISRFKTSLATDGNFYTDSSGRETIQRKKDYRPTWDVDIQEPVAGNYYPVTTDISISDGTTAFAVVTDRSQGGASLNDGEIELLIHRRLLHDDAFGVGEALNETAYGTGLVARGKHWIISGDVNDPEWSQQKTQLRQQKVLDSFVGLADAGSIDFDTWSKNYKLEFSGLTDALPDAVQILTLEPWKDSTYLLRLEHLYEKGDPQGEAVTVNLENLFSTFDIITIKETNLAANKWIDEVSRFEWRKETRNTVSDSKSSTKALPEVTLNPKQIRTFVCEIQPKTSS